MVSESIALFSGLRFAPLAASADRAGLRFACLLLLWAVAFSAVPTADARESILVGENTRMSFSREIVRIAVGNPQIANVQMVSNREILVLGMRAGQTNLLLWDSDGLVLERALRVERDLTLLSEALRAIHPAIEAVSAPDQNAVVLIGVVPEVRFSRAAERVASDYLRGGGFNRQRRGALILGADGGEEGATGDGLADGAEAGAALGRGRVPGPGGAGTMRVRRRRGLSK